MPRKGTCLLICLVGLIEPNGAAARDVVGELFEIELPGLEGSGEPDARIREPEAPELIGVPIRWDACATGRDDPRALQRLGAGALALAHHADAAAAFEELARRFPAEDGHDCTPGEREAGSCPRAAEALWDATVLRIAIGDLISAEADAALHQKLYARRRPRETSALLLGVAAEHALAGDHRAAARIYDGLARIGSDARIPALVGRAKALEGLGERRRALADLTAAETAWETLERASARPGPGPAEASSGSGRAAEAVTVVEAGSEPPDQATVRQAAAALAEGRFHRAQTLGRAFEELELPRFVGPRTEGAIGRWARARLAPWIRSALADLREAEDAFGRVAALRVPRWTIAALARVGQLRRHLRDLVRQVPRPPMDPALERAYQDLVTDRGEMFADLAADAFRACLDLAVTTREYGPWSALCANELDSLEPRRSLPELRPAPSIDRRAGGPMRSREAPGWEDLYPMRPVRPSPGRRAMTQNAGGFVIPAWNATAGPPARRLNYPPSAKEVGNAASRGPQR